MRAVSSEVLQPVSGRSGFDQVWLPSRHCLFQTPLVEAGPPQLSTSLKYRQSGLVRPCIIAFAIQNHLIQQISIIGNKDLPDH